MSRLLSFCSLLVALASVACSPPDRPAVEEQIDTIGESRIEVTNPPVSEPDDGFRMVVEDLRLGAVDGADSSAYVFGDVSSIASDSRGSIYVLDAHSQHILVFQRDGRLSHTIGGEGSGPGQFTFADFIAVGAGDTLFVRDDGLMRYSMFAPDGTLVRTGRRDIVGKHGAVIPTVMSDGTFVDWAPVSPDGRAAARFQLYPIRHTGDFRETDTLPPLEYTWQMLPSGRMQQTMFDGGVVGAVDASGSIWFAEAAEYRIFRRSPEGDTTLVFEMAESAVPLGEAQRAAVRERFATRPDLMAETLESLPETLPIIQRIVPDNAGHVFVFPRLADAPLGRVVDVFDTGGIHRERLELPVTLPLSSRSEPIVHIQEGQILAVVKDELDVPYVVRFVIGDDGGS